MKKNKINFLSLACCLLVGGLVSCGSSTPKLDAITDFTFDVETGQFSFATVENAEYYQATILRRINKDTYDALKADERTNKMAVSETVNEETWYFWNENICSATRLSDKRLTGKVTKKFSLRTYSNSATSAGEAVNFSTLAPGDYAIIVIANEVEGSYSESEPYIYGFTKGGTLSAPDGFTFKVNDDNQLEISAASNYFYQNLTANGLPSELKYEVKNGSSVLETLSVTDFSWYNTIQGPTNAFTFNNATVKSSKKDYSKDLAEDYVVNVTAVGDGGEVKDASSTASFSYTFGTFADFTFTCTGEEGSYVGADSFTFTGTVNDAERSFTATKAATEGNQDFAYSVVDAKGKLSGTLTLAKTTSRGWDGKETTSYTASLKLGTNSLSGSYTVENGVVKVTGLKSGGGGGWGGPGGGGFPGGGPQ